MLIIKDKILEKREWYQNPMTQAFNEKLKEYTELSEDEIIDICFSGLLEAKGLHTHAEKQKFLQVENGECHDPFKFDDMELACEIITQSIQANESIMIYGDYDCDGLTATSILVRTLRDVGANVSYFVPDRLQDGYGLSDQTICYILTKQPDLLITVDCGVNDTKEIMQLMQAGIKVIVTDHHQTDEKKNNPALATINPQIKDESYPFTGLAGAGVAFKLAQALVTYLKMESYDLSFALCLAAVGTVADSMPLEDENRVLVFLATSIFKEKAPLGLRMFAEKFNQSSLIDASFFGFFLGPRLNAAGRMGDLKPALTLLLSDDQSETLKAIDDLELLNHQRKQLEQEIFLQANEQVEKMEKDQRKNIIIVSDIKWHSGVAGIVSSRLAQKYSLPVITFAGSDGALQGSARSIGSFDILAAISSAADYTESYGGHLQAAGVKVDVDKLSAFKQQVINYAEAFPIKKSSLKDFQYQFTLPHKVVNDTLAKQLTYFEPYGQGNEKANFVLENLKIDQWRAVGQGKHISLTLRLEDGRLISGIAFHAHNFFRLYRSGDQVDLLANLNWQEWNGSFSSKLQILDWHMSSTGSLLWDEPQRIEETYHINNKNINSLMKMYGIAKNQLTINNEQIKAVTEYFKQYKSDLENNFNISLLARAIARERQIFINPFVLQRIIDMFSEMKLLKYEQIDLYNLIIYFLPQGVERKNLKETETWKRMNAQELILDGER